MSPDETKQHLLAIRAELDLASLHHEILRCQEQLDAMAKQRQPRSIIKGGSYAHFSDESTT